MCFMDYLHWRVRILILILIETANQIVTLYYAEFFILHRAGLRFQSQLPATGMGSELESGSVNKPLAIREGAV